MLILHSLALFSLSALFLRFLCDSVSILKEEIRNLCIQYGRFALYAAFIRLDHLVG